MAVISAATEMTTVFDWHDLPFREIWCVDTEFYPGAGLANGARYGDAMTPLCLVALEMRSGRLIRLWQDELGRFPPYRLDAGALIVGYMFAAEFGFHIARGWGEPACALDAYLEFRHLMNDGAAKSEDRDKGFFGLSGALRYFCEDEIDVTRKHDTRDRILRGPPFSAQEQRDIVAYCEDDVRALARLLPHIVPTIRSLPHAMFRAKCQCSRSDAVFRPICLCSRVFVIAGRVCGSTWSPSWTAPLAVTRLSTANRIGAKSGSLAMPDATV
jgi:hypothetical protein